MYILELDLMKEKQYFISRNTHLPY